MLGSQFLDPIIARDRLSRFMYGAFESVSLAEMDAVALMNRVDTKYFFSQEQLYRILEKSADDYRVLEVGGIRLCSYETQYFDKVNCDLFLRHHNGFDSRYKVRIRQYVESEMYYLEIKHKRKGRTDKKRMPVSGFRPSFQGEEEMFVGEMSQLRATELVPMLINRFKRITLVNRKDKERITIDTELSFSNDFKNHDLEHVVIAEVKQEQLNRNSPFVEQLRLQGLRPQSISKYCIGMLGLYPHLKHNKFKKTLLKIKKLQENVAIKKI